jgi:alanine racemase
MLRGDLCAANSQETMLRDHNMDATIEPTMMRPTWYEIDLDAICENYRTLRNWVGTDVKIYSCLKRNAYGCGIQAVSRSLEKEGTDGLAVGNINDALAIRKAGVELPILLYPNCLPETASVVSENRLTPTVSSEQEAQAWAQATQRPLSVFPKIDVGLLRGGVLPDKAVSLIKAITENKLLRLAGIYTHFHGYDPATGSDYARLQFERFHSLLEEVHRIGIDVPVRIAAGSLVVLQFPEMDLNGVDPGSVLFGIRSASGPERTQPLHPALRSIKTRILLIKDIQPHHIDNHPSPFPVEQPVRMGLVPFGWGDGMPRYRPDGASALVRGHLVPIIGPIHFEHMRLDLSSVSHAAVGDEVVLLGHQGQAQIDIESVAEQWGMDVLQFYGNLRDHVARRYSENNNA